MVRRIFTMIMMLSMIVLSMSSVFVEAQPDAAYVRTRPIPEALQEVAVPYEGSMDQPRVCIRMSLPEILLDSPDAHAANQEIAALEDALVAEYQESLAQWQHPYPFSFYSACRYEANVYADVLSIHIEISNGIEFTLAQTHLFNFDLTSGRRLTDTELVEKMTAPVNAPVDWDLLLEENIAREARRLGDDFAWQMLSSFYPLDPSELRPTYSSLVDRSVGKTLGMVRDDNLEHQRTGKDTGVLYLSNNGMLHVVYRQDSPAGAGFFYNETTFYPFSFPHERVLNPVFVSILRDLGQDPWQSPYEGLTARLGFAHDDETLRDLLFTVAAFSRQWNDDASPAPVLSYEDTNVTGGNAIGNYSEFYLVIPKYANDFIEMCGLDVTQQGEIFIKPDDVDQSLRGYALGVGLIGITAETLPTGGLRFSNLREQGDFWFPSLSGKDGSLVLPDTILDITETVETCAQTYAESDLYVDEDLLQFITAGWPQG